MKKEKKKGILLLVFGCLPYVLLLLITIGIMIGGTSDCIISFGSETECNIVYGFAALEKVLFMLLASIFVWWYIIIPIIIISVLCIVKGIKLLINKEKQR